MFSLKVKVTQIKTFCKPRSPSEGAIMGRKMIKIILHSKNGLWVDKIFVATSWVLWGFLHRSVNPGDSKVNFHH